MYHLDEIRPQYQNGGKKPTKEDIKRRAAKPKPAQSTFEKQVTDTRRRAGIADYRSLKTTGKRPLNQGYITYIDSYLRNNGYTDIQRAAVLGQIIEESGGDPFAISSTGKYRGIAQWDSTRYKDFDDTRDPYEELDSQLQYLNTSIRNDEGGIDWTHGGSGSKYDSYKDAYNNFWNSNDLNKVSKAVSYGYVRPEGKEQSHINRLGVARQVLARLVPLE